MEQLIYEVNNKKYLLVEVLLTPETVDKLNKYCKDYQCIQQGIKEIHTGGFFGKPFAIAKILVPQEKAFEFTQIPLK